MKLWTIFLSLILLTSCDDFPGILPQERCFVVLDQEQIIQDIPFYSGHCRCHMYQWGEHHIGRITDSVNKPLNYCDKLGGFGPDSTGAIYSWQEAVRLWLIRHKK